MKLTAKARLLRRALCAVENMGLDPEKLYTVEVNGRKIVVSNEVFSPRYFTDTGFFAKHVPRFVRGRTFYEVGIGCGLIALEACLNGAKLVAGSDINPMAIVNTRMNAQRYGVRIRAHEGDLFARIKSGHRYESIFWNHPFHAEDTEPRTMLERAVLDPSYRSLERYFKEAKPYLVPGSGVLLLGTSNIARLKLIFGFADQYGYDRTLLVREEVPFEHRSNQHIELRLYEFRPRA